MTFFFAAARIARNGWPGSPAGVEEFSMSTKKIFDDLSAPQARKGFDDERAAGEKILKKIFDERAAGDEKFRRAHRRLT